MSSLSGETDTMTHTSCLEVPWKTALQVIHWMVMAACITSPLVTTTFKKQSTPVSPPRTCPHH